MDFSQNTCGGWLKNNPITSAELHRLVPFIERDADFAGLGGTPGAWLNVSDGAVFETERQMATIGGLPPEQRFFVGVAQWASENERPENLRMTAVTNPHPPGEYRTEGVVVDMPDFAKAFNCRRAAALAKPLEKICDVWPSGNQGRPTC